MEMQDIVYYDKENVKTFYSFTKRYFQSKPSEVMLVPLLDFRK